MLEQQADIVVIGGGIIGVSCAWFLSRRGLDVVLLEKGAIAGQQSSRAWGFVRQQGRDPAEMPLMVAGNALWQELPAMLGQDIEWVQAGNLAVAQDDERMDQFRDWLAVARVFGVETTVLSRDEVLNMIPRMQGPYIGGMFTPSDGHAEPLATTRAITDAARREGARIFSQCAAVGIETVSGRVTRVISERGPIRTGTVICAAGATSTRIARMIGLSVPQISVRATVAETEPAPPITDIGAWAPQASFRQRRASGTFYVARGAISDHDVNLDSLRFMRYYLPNYMRNRRMFRINPGGELVRDALRSIRNQFGSANPFSHDTGTEPEPNPKTAERSIEGLVSLFPSLTGIGIRRTWAGLIDSTPDALPIIGEVDQPHGFVLATGFSGHGFALGPITGKLLSELIVDGKPSIDLRDMRYSRFADGTPVAPRNIL